MPLLTKLLTSSVQLLTNVFGGGFHDLIDLGVVMEVLHHVHLAVVALDLVVHDLRDDFASLFEPLFPELSLSVSGADEDSLGLHERVIN